MTPPNDGQARPESCHVQHARQILTYAIAGYVIGPNRKTGLITIPVVKNAVVLSYNSPQRGYGYPRRYSGRRNYSRDRSMVR